MGVRKKKSASAGRKWSLTGFPEGGCEWGKKPQTGREGHGTRRIGRGKFLYCLGVVSTDSPAKGRQDSRQEERRGKKQKFFRQKRGCLYEERRRGRSLGRRKEREKLSGRGGGTGWIL